jgi:hypothetical protein
MSIADIRIIKGKRADLLQREKLLHDTLRILARHEYQKYKEGLWPRLGSNGLSFEEWVHSDKHGVDDDIKKITPTPAFRKKLKRIQDAGVILPEDDELSIEAKILMMMKDGWVMKGDPFSAENAWVQIMVRYGKTT